MRAVIHARQRAGVHIGVVVGVVVCERNLLADVAAVLALAHLRHLRADARLGFSHGGVVQVSFERGVIHVKARVDDGHQLAFATLVNLVGLGHVQRILVHGGILNSLVSGHFIAALDERILHAVQAADGFQQVRRRLDGEAVDGVVVVLQLLEFGLLFLRRVAGRVVGVLGGEQRDALRLLFADHAADLILEVAVARLLHRSHDAAEQADALRAAVLKLHDDGDVALRIRAVGLRLLHGLLNGRRRGRLLRLVVTVGGKRGRGRHHQCARQRQRQTRADNASALLFLAHVVPFVLI